MMIKYIFHELNKKHDKFLNSTKKYLSIPGISDNTRNNIDQKDQRKRLIIDKSIEGVTQKLFDRLKKLPFVSNSHKPNHLSNLAFTHHVSPRKRILRELEKVTIDDSFATMKKSRAKASELSSSETFRKTPSKIESSVVLKRQDGVESVPCNKVATKSRISSYSITSLLSYDGSYKKDNLLTSQTNSIKVSEASVESPLPKHDASTILGFKEKSQIDSCNFNDHQLEFTRPTETNIRNDQQQCVLDINKMNSETNRHHLMHPLASNSYNFSQLTTDHSTFSNYFQKYPSNYLSTSNTHHPYQSNSTQSFTSLNLKDRNPLCKSLISKSEPFYQAKTNHLASDQTFSKVIDTSSLYGSPKTTTFQFQPENTTFSFRKHLTFDNKNQNVLDKLEYNTTQKKKSSKDNLFQVQYATKEDIETAVRADTSKKAYTGSLELNHSTNASNTVVMPSPEYGNSTLASYYQQMYAAAAHAAAVAYHHPLWFHYPVHINPTSTIKTFPTSESPSYEKDLKSSENFIIEESTDGKYSLELFSLLNYIFFKRK